MLDLSRLNPPQREAVLHDSGPLVVFAGAGSGKTRVITYRIAHLVSERGVAPEQILAVTFTNKAAGEMRERIRALLPGVFCPWIGTFHAICARLLRRHAEAVGINPQFVIYDDTDQKAMLTRVVRDLDLDERRFAPRELARQIEAAKRDMLGPEDVSTRSYEQDIVQRVYASYEERMQQCGALDFNDLIYRTALALRKHDGLRAMLQRFWKHVLVDEFQDTNLSQLELVRVLSADHQNLCVVGDDDQSIYKWRGADRRNILDFKTSFPAAEVVKLEQNYRSSAHILSAAMAVIAKNGEREPKNLWTENPEGEKVRLIVCADERDEARAISEAVRKLRDHYGLSQMVIFYRTHAQSRVLEEEIRACNLPYRIVGGQRFYERAEVKDVLAYLRVLVNPDDDVSLLRIINTPTRGIGKTTVDKLLDMASQRGASVWSTVDVAVTESALPKAAHSKLSAFRDLIVDVKRRATAGLGPAELAEYILEQTGYLQALRTEDTAEADGRIENVEELVASVREFESEAEVPTLAQYLELVTLQSNADEVNADEKLTLMTVHAAKGLEFPVVWVAGLEERVFPLSRQDALSHDDLEEERRLAYVAFTRAEQRLYLSYACARRLHGDLMVGIPSRFVDEIPAEHIQHVSRVGNGYGAARSAGSGGSYGYGGGFGYGSSGRASGYPSTARSSYPPSNRAASSQRFMGAKAPPPKAAARAPGESYVDRSDADEGGSVFIGMRVRHAKYGEGQVKSVEGGHPPRVTVQFTGWGVKQIVASFLEPA
jgi:DNA helicase-2/ATP-dependent DNA helicase PcrA